MNILKIIKKAPKDHVYYCTIIGEVQIEIDEESDYPINCKGATGVTIRLTDEGRYYIGTGGECLLFPSKDQRNWSELEKILEETIVFKPFDKVLCRDYDNEVWRPDFFGFIVEDGTHKYYCVESRWKQCIPFEGNEDKLGKV